ncbi:MAG: cysteine--tRNA ligase [Nanoarchaeota archaeon]|nr:cysteine--tRNA ligase [Nanoarchaeota archaeon]
MTLKLYNTLTRKKENFKPLKKGHVGMYACGPTVYWFQHIGNMRSFVYDDVMKRVLTYNGFKVKHVINITDVGHLTSDADEGEDKMLKALKREGLPLNKESMLKMAKKYTEAFQNDLKKLNVIGPDIWCKATEHINEMEELIKRIRKNGHTYLTNVGIIFDTSKSKDYGVLAGLKFGELKAGARVEIDPERKNPSDFALWITNQPNHIMQWDFIDEITMPEREYEKLKKISENSPNVKILEEVKGSKKSDKKVRVNFRGFPGWHIECSAMSMKYLGENFDIHIGGQEHIQIHHTNEIAQSEAATGKKFVNYWLHNQWLLFKGEKMAKSKGELALLSDLEKKGYDPMAFRYFCLTASYRTQLDFTYENLDSAKNAYENLKRKIIELKKDKEKFHENNVEEQKRKFLEIINDDFNMPGAIAFLNGVLKEKELKDCEKYHLALDFDKVLGLNLKDLKEEKIPISKDIQKLLDEREKARETKNWKKSDEIRDEIKKKGFNVLDNPDGQKLEKRK